MEQMPSCRDDQTLIAARVESTCCISYICGTVSWLVETISVFAYAMMSTIILPIKAPTASFSSPNIVKLEGG